MNVGDYVRTENGCICKVLEYTDISDNDFYVNTDSPYNVIYKSWIVKSSPNIIDLIEVGDYVNGYKVFNIETSYILDENHNRIGEKIRLDIGNVMYGYTIYIEEKDIKSIVTKEQFEAIKYEIK